MQVVAGMVVYAITTWLFKDVWIATAITVALLFLYMLFTKKRISESAGMALVVVSGFLLLDKLQFLAKWIPGPMQRLVDRKAIWADALWKLKLAAEFDAGRRGPRPRRRSKERTSR